MKLYPRPSAWAAVLRGAIVLSLALGFAAHGADAEISSNAVPLSSWNEGPARAAITDFVAAVTDPGGPNFVPPAERIAVFDNDGTLWAEQPAYFQLLFAIDRVRALVPEHPEWATRQPFAAVLANDMAALAAGGEHALMELIMATHAGMTTEDFSAVVAGWLETARHPGTGRAYTEMVYQPMLELLAFLRANGFQTWIVSGGGIDFMRVFTESVYGIPPEQVVGSSIVTRFEMRGDTPVIVREPKIGFIDAKAGKPVAIQAHIGRRPIAAFGNSDGDLQMLQWTAAGDGRRLAAFVHHTDAAREWAYDRASHIGRFDAGLDEAQAKGWLLIDMQRDLRRVFPGDPSD